MEQFPTLFDIESLFMMACSCLAAIIGYINRNKFDNLRLFYIYPLSSFIQMSIHYTLVFSNFDLRIKRGLSNSNINIFLLIEAIMIYHFFLVTFKSYTIKRILYAIGGLYLLLIFYFWFMKGLPFYNSQHLLTYQAVVVLVPCVIYFFELLKNQTVVRLTEYPPFWIVIGTIFYFGCTLPLFLLLNFLLDKNGDVQSYIYAINYICYSVYFLLITKAYVCPKKTSTI